VTREQAILRSILAQKGAVLPCFRCDVKFTCDDAIQKEHLHERALDGPDVWGNWRWSHKDCHAIATDGTKATTAGSSTHRIAKTNDNRVVKFIVNKPSPGEAKPKEDGKRPWPSRKIMPPSDPWNKRYREQLELAKHAKDDELDKDFFS